MSIYYQDELVTLYHGDCLVETAWLDADVLVTDPPYGRAWRQGQIKSDAQPNGHTRNDKSEAGIEGDSDTSARDAVLNMWGERPGIAFGDLMLAPPAGTRLVCVYAKPGDGGLRGAMSGVRRDAEAIYLVGRHKSGIGGRSSIFKTSRPMLSGSSGLVAKSGGHPHTKPTDLMSELISLVPGAVADPFAGSGSTLVAARNLGRRVIGVELEERYCEVIAKRLAQGAFDFGEAS